MKYLLLLFTGLFFMASCKDVPKTDLRVINETSGGAVTSEKTHPGKELLEKECYSCHNPRAAQSEMIAPPMIAVKKHYLNDATSKDQFINLIVNWVKDPSEENSKMQGALRKFGTMPYQSFPEEMVVKIADYLYDNEIDAPDWFNGHMNMKAKGHGKGKGKGKNMQNCSGNCMGDGQCKHMGQVAVDTMEKYKKLGKKYASNAKATLGKKLVQAIVEKGPDGAVEFCNLNAIPLTDSLSIAQGIKIRRVTDKPRNPLNRASAKELVYINDFKVMVSSGETVDPILNVTEEQVDFYYPITTNAMCLQCHGVPERQITTSTLAALENLYPTDKARDYQENQVRGMWAISLNRTNLED